jgi:hypothetical protein
MGPRRLEACWDEDTSPYYYGFPDMPFSGSIVVPGPPLEVEVSLSGPDAIPSDGGDDFQVALSYPVPSDPIMLEVSSEQGPGAVTFVDGHHTEVRGRQYSDRNTGPPA